MAYNGVNDVYSEPKCVEELQLIRRKQHRPEQLKRPNEAVST